MKACSFEAKPAIFLVVCLFAVGLAIQAQNPEPVTVQDLVRFRLFNVFDSFGPQLRLSPDGRLIAYMLSESNLEKNENELVIYIVPTDSSTSSAALGRGREVARLQAASWVLNINSSNANVFKWQGDGSGIFVLNKPKGESRAVISRIDIKTLKNQVWYRSELDIEDFEISDAGDQVLIRGRRFLTDRPARLDSQKGVVISPDESIKGLRERRHAQSIRSIRRGGPELTIYDAEAHARLYSLSLSSDGRWMTFAESNTTLEALRKDPLCDDVPGCIVNWLIDLHSLSASRSPATRLAHNVPFATIIKWSDDGSSYLVGSLLPIADGRSVQQRREHGRILWAVDAASGKKSIVPDVFFADQHRRNGFWDVIAYDENASRILLKLNSGHFVTFRKQGGEWRETERVAATSNGGIYGGNGVVGNGKLTIWIEQSPGTAPDFFVADVLTGKKTRLTEINPELREQKLGKVEKIEWKGPHGEINTGYLIYPVDFVPSKKYACVMPFYSSWDTGFKYSLFWNTFPLQAFAGNDMFVLLPWYTGKGRDPKPDEELKRHRAQIADFLKQQFTLTSAKEELNRRGLIDPDRVGLLGFSASGQVVLNEISRKSDTKKPEWAAAMFVDSFTPMYSDYFMLGEGRRTLIKNYFGGPPFGKYLKAWEAYSPSFTTHRVRTPLMIQMHGDVRNLKAELFTVLHSQGKPVEMVWYPDEQGTLRGQHALKMPTERESSMQRTIDWFRFWLQDYERTVPAPRETAEELVAQYRRWRKLREQHKWNEKMIAEGKDPAVEYMDEMVKRDAESYRSDATTP